MSAKNDESTWPPSLLKLAKTYAGYVSVESNEQALNFKPGPNDVIISTALKSGTTVMQQICHGLRSGGDMSFDEIDLVIPNIQTALDFGYGDLHQRQTFQPQMFKVHLPYDDTPKGAGKYIAVVRKPADVALSFYYFLKNWLFTEEDKISVADFVEWFYLKMGRVDGFDKKCFSMNHIMSWYPHRLNKNVLWVHYEDIKQDLRGCVRMVAKFLEIGADNEELQELVTKQASLEFMKQYPTKYDEHHLKLARNEGAGLPKYAGLTNNTGKIRNGLIDGSKECIPQHLLDKIDQVWDTTVTAVTGKKTYDEFRNSINKELNRKFS